MPPASALRCRAAATRSHSGRNVAISSCAIAGIARKRRLRRDTFRRPVWGDHALVLALGIGGEPAAEAAILRRQLHLGHGLQIADGVRAAGLQPSCRGLADAVDLAHRQRCQKRLGLAGADHGEAARLVQFGRELGQELVGGQADRNGDPDLALDPVGDRRQGFGRGRGLGAPFVGEIQIGFVERDGLDGRGGAEHDRADLGADGLVLGHVGRDDDGASGTTPAP